MAVSTRSCFISLVSTIRMRATVKALSSVGFYLTLYLALGQRRGMPGLPKYKVNFVRQRQNLFPITTVFFVQPWYGTLNKIHLVVTTIGQKYLRGNASDKYPTCLFRECLVSPTVWNCARDIADMVA